MLSAANWLLAALALVTVLSFLTFSLVWYRPYRSHLRHLRGPKRSHLIFGDLREITDDENNELLDRWVKEYGNTWRLGGFLNTDVLFTTDTRAVNHVLTHGNDYPKPSDSKESLRRIFGDGLLVVEGAEHRQQRRIMNPAFGPAQIRELTETFFMKALRLRDLWSSEIANDPTAKIANTRIDIVPWMSRVTLDIIGLTGFNYNFDTLNSSGQPNELSEAFSTMFSESQKITILDAIDSFFPVLRFVPTTESRTTQAARRTMEKIGKQLLTKAKASAQAIATDKGEIPKNSLQGRDLLSLLVKANMATDIPESQRLSDEDVIAQVPTFFVAGHETTSTAVTWALYALSQVPDVQTKLREELLSVDTDTPSMDKLTSLPYLDAVMRETLRVHTPVPHTSRIAVKSGFLPVEKPYNDRHGVLRDTITITKGDRIIIPIREMNLSEDLWGPDAREFKPERWENVPDTVSYIPGVWGHLLTFLGGPRACIGYRFSLVEFKAILFTLVRSFEFRLAVPANEVRSRSAVVQRPVLLNDPTHQPQLPLLVRLYQGTWKAETCA